jgi:hypothetical protein
MLEMEEGGKKDEGRGRNKERSKGKGGEEWCERRREVRGKKVEEEEGKGRGKE